MQCHLDYLNLNFHCLSLNSLPLTPNNKRNSHVVFVHRRHLNFSFIFHHKMELLNSFCSMVIGRSLSAFKIDELSTNFLICDHTSFNCGRSKFLAKLNDEDMIISKAVKPGEDINENDRLIFCCRHPFFKIYMQNLCTRSCRAGPATPSAKQ